jgi:hypothetical protein
MHKDAIEHLKNVGYLYRKHKKASPGSYVFATLESLRNGLPDSDRGRLWAVQSTEALQPEIYRMFKTVFEMPLSPPRKEKEPNETTTASGGDRVTRRRVKQRKARRGHGKHVTRKQSCC